MAWKPCEILERVRPDLIVTDMQMPKMTGNELDHGAEEETRDREHSHYYCRRPRQRL